MVARTDTPKIRTVKVEFPIELPPEPDLGPKMLALGDDRERKFVWAMVLNGGNKRRAAEAAGYSHTQDRALDVAAWRLMQRREVLDALHECAWRFLHGAALSAIQTVVAIAANPRHPARLEAAFAIMDRTGFHAKTEHKVAVEHTDNAEMIRLAMQFAAQRGIDPKQLLGSNRIIDAEFQVVESEPAPDA